jgi:hypothetical protein
MSESYETAEGSEDQDFEKACTYEIELTGGGYDITWTRDVESSDIVEYAEKIDEFITGDDLGVVTGRFDEVRKVLDEESNKENGDIRSYMIGQAFGVLVQKYSQPSSVDTDLNRFAGKVLDSSSLDDMTEDYFRIGVINTDESHLDHFSYSFLPPKEKIETDKDIKINING